MFGFPEDYSVHLSGEGDPFDPLEFVFGYLGQTGVEGGVDPRRVLLVTIIRVTRSVRRTLLSVKITEKGDRRRLTQLRSVIVSVVFSVFGP